MTAFMDKVLELVNRAIQKAPEVLLTFLVGYVVIKVVQAALSGALGYSRANKAMRGIILSVANIVLWVFLLSAVLQQIGLSQISLALSGTVAISTLAIAVGSSSMVSDLVAGVFLAQDTDFNSGDNVKIGDVEGVVERMDARKVRLRDKNGQLHVYPNSFLDKTQWTLVRRKKDDH